MRVAVIYDVDTQAIIEIVCADDPLRAAERFLQVIDDPRHADDALDSEAFEVVEP